MRGQHIGSTIAAGFGLIYVLVNSGGQPTALAWALRIAALVVCAAVVARLVAAHRSAGGAEEGGSGRRISGDRGSRPAPFGRAYWLIVVAEVVAIVVGVRVLAGPLDHPEAGVAWVSVAVGAHFFALAAHFRLRFFHLVGVLVTACGVVGLLLAFATPAADLVSLVGGVVPGFVLLGFALWGTERRGTPARPSGVMPGRTRT